MNDSDIEKEAEDLSKLVSGAAPNFYQAVNDVNCPDWISIDDDERRLYI